MIGWGTWIRTKILGVRVRCSAVELFPNEETSERPAARRSGSPRAGPEPDSNRRFSLCWSVWQDSNLRPRASKARTLTRLSYTQLKWRSLGDSNSGPLPSQGSALSTELREHDWRSRQESNLHAPVTVPCVRSAGRLRDHEMARLRRFELRFPT
jgi:hypothetical protein